MLPLWFSLLTEMLQRSTVPSLSPHPPSSEWSYALHPARAPRQLGSYWSVSLILSSHWLRAPPACSESQGSRRQHNLPLESGHRTGRARGIFSCLEQLRESQTIDYSSRVLCYTIEARFYKLSFGIYALIFPNMTKYRDSSSFRVWAQQRVCLSAVQSGLLPT